MTIGRKTFPPATRTIARLARARIDMKMIRGSTPYRKRSRASNGPALIHSKGFLMNSTSSTALPSPDGGVPLGRWSALA